jgi:hypothetical protein
LVIALLLGTAIQVFINGAVWGLVGPVGRLAAADLTRVTRCSSLDSRASLKQRGGFLPQPDA